MVRVHKPSARAEAVTRRTYQRPLDDTGTKLETWEQTARRATYDHHKWLWETAGGRPNEAELEELFQLQLNRKASVAGRTLWLGGTPYGRERACSQFNCSYTHAQTVYQFVDAFWLLLNGCGLGFRPQAGTLHGFLQPIHTIELIGSNRGPHDKGRSTNTEQHPSPENNYHWIIGIGDSAEAWAKSLGKLINPPRTRVNKLTIDASEVRGPGGRLKGYGWICNGWEPLLTAYGMIVKILNAKAGDLLDEIDLLDVMNHLGTVLSSRRSAQIALMDHGHPRWEEFSTAKHNHWVCKTCDSHNTHRGKCNDCGAFDTNIHRQQSNNSLTFWWKPSKKEIRELMQMIWDAGGSEPGFVNGAAARRRAPWFSGMNPCGEILLSSSGFCNLVTTSVPRFRDDFSALVRALRVMGRANYRQTCVNLNDGTLSPEWGQTNEALRLCGMSLTGIAMAPWLTDYQIKMLRDAAVNGAYSMADELGLPRPKLVTTIKPEGTGSKCMDVTEGLHKPLGSHIFNWINFPHNDPMVALLEAAGYRTMENPNDKNGMLVCFPVEYANVKLHNVDGRRVNLDSAVTQLNHYRRWNTLWTDHNSSITVSWDIDELDEIVDWLDRYWDDFVAVSWLRRADPTLKAKDLGYKYLPQEVVLEGDYRQYVDTLRDVDWSALHGIHELDVSDCAGGVCPVR